LSSRALARAAKTPYRGTYFDFLSFKTHADTDGVPSTPSIPHFYALAAQLDHIVRGDERSGKFSIVAMRGSDVVGALSVNAAKEMAMLRRVIAANARPSRADLESPAYDLRAALK